MLYIYIYIYIYVYIYIYSADEREVQFLFQEITSGDYY